MEVLVTQLYSKARNIVYYSEIRLMSNTTYPMWSPKQWQISRDHFIRGVLLPSVQLLLMNELPKTLELAGIGSVLLKSKKKGANPEMFTPVTIANINPKF